MNHAQLLNLYDQHQRVNIEYPGARKEVLPGIVRFVRPAPGMNFIAYSRLDPALADAAIQAQVDYFRPMGQPFEWIVYEHDSPPDLLDRLAAHGFEISETEPILTLSLREVPPALLAPVSADVRRITTRAGLEDVITVMERVYGGNFGWIRQRLGDHLEIPGYLSVYAAYVDEQPACAGWIYYHPRDYQGSSARLFAGLWGGSTVEEQRGKGLYTAILTRRVQEAIQRDYHYLYINASSMSEPIVRKHGFQLLARMRACEWQRQ